MTKRTRADKLILQGAKEALAHARGEKIGRSHFVITADVDVKAIRKKTDLTQELFAETYGFSLWTLKNWERGHRKPDGAAKAYLLVISVQPNVVREALTTALAVIVG